MLSIFNGLRTVTMLSVTVRMLLAVACGGIIGIGKPFVNVRLNFRHVHGQEKRDRPVDIPASLDKVAKQFTYLSSGNRLGLHGIAYDLSTLSEFRRVEFLQNVFCELFHISSNL